MRSSPNRRTFLGQVGTVAGSSLLPFIGAGCQQSTPGGANVPSEKTSLAGKAAVGNKKPTSPVAVGRVVNYELKSLLSHLQKLVDQIGGFRRLVSGKTVVVKPNLTGNPEEKFMGLTAGQTFQVHPNLVLATAILLDEAGARRIRFVESASRAMPFELRLQKSGWDLNKFLALDATIEFEDTRNRGKGKKYHEVKVPWGGSLFPAYLLNHSYIECDVYISLAKLKNHVAAGVTLSMKNNFGITPNALYGQSSPDENSTSARLAIFHDGTERPGAGIPQELNPGSPRKAGYRVPRNTIDTVGIRPIDLSIIDGIETISGGEGPWSNIVQPVKPDLLLVGRNPVCTDSVATALMGYDPMASAGNGPFPGDNHLSLAAAVGLGTNDPREIEVLGPPIDQAIFPFNWKPTTRNI